MRRLGFACLLVLSGCSSVSDLLSFDGKPDDEAVATTQAQAAAPAAPAAPDDSFCRNVAAQDATASGFDEATQKRVALQSYSQCQMLHGNSTSR